MKTKYRFSLLFLLIFPYSLFAQDWSFRMSANAPSGPIPCNGNYEWEVLGLGNVDFNEGLYVNPEPYGDGIATHTPTLVSFENLCYEQEFGWGGTLSYMFIETAQCIPLRLNMNSYEYQSGETTLGLYSNQGGNFELTISVTAPTNMQANDGEIHYSFSGQPSDFSVATYRGTQRDHTNGVASLMSVEQDLTGLEASFYYILFESDNSSRKMKLEFALLPLSQSTCDSPYFRDIITTPTDSNACNGVVYFDVINGTHPHQYEIPSVDGSAQATPGLCAGSYTVTVIDANGATLDGDFVIGGFQNVVNYTDPISFSDYDTLFTDILETCNIDYDLIIDSVNITNTTLNPPLELAVEWIIYQAGNEFIVTGIYELDSIAPTMFSLTVHCEEGRAESSWFQLFDFIELNASELLGIEQANEVRIELYPNPTANKLYLKCKTPLSKIWLTDLTGRALMPLTKNGAFWQADISGLSTGVYLVDIYFENNDRAIKKVVKTAVF